jgi:HSP20 family protein
MRETHMANIAPERRRASGSVGQWPSFEQVPERMRRMLEQTLGSFGSPALLSEASIWTPLVDIEEEDEAYVIEADLPGVRREDMTIELVGNELSISGEIRERERKGIVRRRSRHTGRFDYHVTLPSLLEVDKIEARLADGVLALRVPKAGRARRQRIEVKGS